MGITDAIGKGIGLANMLGPQDKFIKKATEQLELSKAETSDKIDVKETRLGEVSQLQKVLSEIKAKASCLTNPLQAGFDRKAFSTSTQQDFGNTDDYITNIHVDDKVLVGDTKIAVERVATASELVLSLANDVGFNKGVALDKDGLMTLTVGGQPRVIDIVIGDTVEQITGKINHSFLRLEMNLKLFLLKEITILPLLRLEQKIPGLELSGLLITIEGLVLFLMEVVYTHKVTQTVLMQ